MFGLIKTRYEAVYHLTEQRSQVCVTEKTEGLMPVAWFLSSGTWVPALFMVAADNPTVASKIQQYEAEHPYFATELAKWLKERDLNDIGFSMTYFPGTSAFVPVVVWVRFDSLLTYCMNTQKPLLCYQRRPTLGLVPSTSTSRTQRLRHTLLIGNWRTASYNTGPAASPGGITTLT